MKRDRVSMEILSVLKESDNIKNKKEVLTEMPQKLKIRHKTKGYGFRELSPRVQHELSGKDKMDSAKDARERFKQDADLDLQNKLNAFIPNVFKDTSMARYTDNEYSNDYTYVDVDYTAFAKFMCDKFPELEYNEDSYGDRDSFQVDLTKGASEGTLRKVLSRKTNFDDLRRQQKVAINDYLINICNELIKIFKENKEEFEAKRGEYSKYTNLSDKEKEDELNKYWYDQYGKVIRAKDLDESFIKEHKLKEAIDLDTEDYIEIYNFDELDDYIKSKMTDRKVKLQIQKMFDRMTEILEEEFSEYMSARGLDLEPGQFDVEKLLYNMTHESSGRYWGPNYITTFNITKSELVSYINNNIDLAEKYSQEEIDRLLNFLTTDKGDSQPVYTINFDGRRAYISGNFNFRKYHYDSDEDKYFDGADEKLEKLYQDLMKDLSLDFYSSYKLLDKAMKQLRDEAKEIVYAKMSKSKDRYLRGGEKFDSSKYDIIDEEPSDEV